MPKVQFLRRKTQRMYKTALIAQGRCSSVGGTTCHASNICATSRVAAAT